MNTYMFVCIYTCTYTYVGMYTVIFIGLYIRFTCIFIRYIFVRIAYNLWSS